MEELNRVGFTGIGYSLHSEIVAPYLLQYGTEAQKLKYLPRLASGEMIGAIPMSELAAGAKGTSLLLVERGIPDFSVGKRLKKLGLKAQDTSGLFFNNVCIPADHLPGGPAQENRGFYRAAAGQHAEYGHRQHGQVLVQLFGGYGYMWEYPITRAYADARVQRIYGGTNEITKEVITRSMGLGGK